MVLLNNLFNGSSVAQPRSHPPSIQSAEPAFVPPANRRRDVPRSASLALPPSEVIPELLGDNITVPTSRTWTPSTGGPDFLSEGGEEQDRSIFVEKYNKLASKNGVRPLVVGDFDAHLRNRVSKRNPFPEKKKSWFSRLLRGSSNQSTPKKVAPVPPTHKRSTSDQGSFTRSRSDAPRILDIQDLVRLTGSSLLYLPPGFSPHPLVLPTCLRATAHYLAENPDNRGVFRVPGSSRTVNALCDYYCDAGGSDPYISSTTYHPTLPASIPHRVHDVASTFKRILSGLPIGVLGSITLFDAFLAIFSELQDRLEVPAEKLKKTRARLIALAIQTIDSRPQRDLICAVFGLLSLIGHATELSTTTDAEGNPLPPNLDNYDIKRSSPTSGLSLIPISAKKRRGRQKAKEPNPDLPDVFKIQVLIDVAEMVISNWRDVVRQMLSLTAKLDEKTAPMQETHDDYQSSVYESFVVNRTMDSGVESRDSVLLRRAKSVGSQLSRQGSGRGPSRQSSLRRMTPTMEEGHQQKDPSNTVPVTITPTSGIVEPASTPTPSPETIRCGQANGFYEDTRWMTPHLKAVDQDGSIIIHGKPRLPDLISIGSDGSHDDNNSKYSGEDKTPTKRRSVKALAAMFEDPHGSPLTTRKPKAGASKDAFGLVEETQEKGIQTDAPIYTSPSTGTENINTRIQELETLLGTKSAEAAQLQLRVQQLEETQPASLSEESRASSKEIQKWKDRAEAAERKAARFQRFTTRIRSIHSSLAMAEGSRQSGDDEGLGSEASGIARYDGVVAEEVQDDLHESQTPSTDGPGVGLGLGIHGDLHGLDGVTSPRMVDFGSAAVAMWIAAQEYLLMEEGEASGSLEVTTSGSSLDVWELADEDF
ncbi:hypothetical protein V8C34DRAFT_315464 [Trichoderma compactum]